MKPSTKVAWLLSVAAIIATCLPRTAFSAKTRLIYTSGRGSVVVQPDSMRVALGIQTEAEALAKAREDNARQMKALMDAVRGLGLPDLAMKTSALDLRILRKPQEGGGLLERLGDAELGPIVGYRVTHHITVRITDTPAEVLSGAAAKIVDAAIGSGANIVRQVSFYREDLDSAHREALAKAVAAARANAEVIAEGLGVKIKSVEHLDCNPRYTTVTYTQAGRRMEDEIDVSTPFAAGDIEIHASASIRCRF
jgi:uncharacterized protein YggE